MSSKASMRSASERESMLSLFIDLLFEHITVDGSFVFWRRETAYWRHWLSSLYLASDSLAKQLKIKCQNHSTLKLLTIRVTFTILIETNVFVASLFYLLE
jgi:hypothetical protein